MSVTWTDFVDFFRFVKKGRVNRAHVLSTYDWSRPTLSVRFGSFLDHSIGASAVWDILPPKTITIPQSWIYGADGKWLGRLGVFFIHRNVTTKENLFWSFMGSETYEAIHRDLGSLTGFLASSCLPAGAVSDWKGAIVTAVASHLGNIPHQRCLAHVERAAKRLLPLNSPYSATQALRRIASLLMEVERPTDARV